MPSRIIITRASAEDAEVRTLIALHLAGMKAASPADAVFALDFSAYMDPDLMLWAARIRKRLAGMIVLKPVRSGVGEIKSMRTHPDFLRKGVARALLERLIADAREAGYKRLVLETGSGPAFDPAIALYTEHGFVSGPAFGRYRKSRFNQFFQYTLD